MKKLFTLLLALAMIPFNAGLAEERMLGVYQMPEGIRETTYINSLVYLDGAIYACAENDIYILRENDKEFSLYAKADGKMGRYIRQLLTDGEKLYAFYSSEGLLCVIESDNGKMAVKEEIKFDMSNHMETYDSMDGESENEFVSYPQALELFGGKLCALYYMGNSDKTVLSLFDIKTGEEEMHDEIENIRGMSAYKDGKLLVTTIDHSKDEGAILYTFDISSGELEEIGPVLQGEDNKTFYGNVMYNPMEDYIFLLQDGGNVYKRNDDGTTERIAYIPTGFFFSGSDSCTLLPGNRMVQLLNSEVHIISLDPNDLPKNTLNILGSMYGNAHEKAIKKLEGTAVNNIDFYGDVAKELSERLVTGAKDIDIMTAQSGQTDIRNIIDKGYALDMSDIPGVKEYYDALYPYYKTVNPDDGKIYAIPVSSQINNFSCNPELFKKLNIEIPETFDDFCDCLAWWYDNQDITEEYNFHEWTPIKGTAWSVLFDTYQSYINMSGQELKYDTPEFRAMVEKLTEALENVEEPEEPMSDEEYQEFYERSTLFGQQPVDIYGISSNNERQRRIEKLDESGLQSDIYKETYPFYPLMLKVEEDVPAGAGAYVAYLMISSQSENIDTAKQYVKAYIEAQDAQEKAQLLENFNELVENLYYQKTLEYFEEAIANAEKQLEEAEGAEKTQQEEMLKDYKLNYQLMLEGEGKYQYTLEDLNEFKGFLKNIYVEDYLNNIVNNEEQLYSLRSRFMEGQIDMETFIKEMDAKLNLIKLENQ